MQKNRQGFTLIELLIVIAIIAILAAGVIIALNPARQFANARNSQRWSHLNSLLSAIQQNIADNKGIFTCAAGALPNTATVMQATGGYDICSCLTPTYMSSLPFDPSVSGALFTSCTTYNTGYTIAIAATTNRITVAAPGAELTQTISLSQ